MYASVLEKKLNERSVPTPNDVMLRRNHINGLKRCSAWRLNFLRDAYQLTPNGQPCSQEPLRRALRRPRQISARTIILSSTRTRFGEDRAKPTRIKRPYLRTAESTKHERCFVSPKCVGEIIYGRHHKHSYVASLHSRQTQTRAV